MMANVIDKISNSKMKFSQSNRQNRDLTEFYSLDSEELPYIEINNPPLKLLIDTGATKSFIATKIVQIYFKKFI